MAECCEEGCCGGDGAGCCEDSDIECDSRLRTSILSAIAGVILGIGWWVYIGEVADTDDSWTKDAAAYSWVPALVGTIAFVMLNAFKFEVLVNSDELDDPSASCKARVWMLVTLLMFAGSFAGGIIFYVKNYTGSEHSDRDKGAGVSVLVNSILILVSAIVMRVGTATMESL